MKVDFHHNILNHPNQDDVGTIRVTARIFRESDNSTYAVLSSTEDFINNELCRGRQDLNYCLMNEEIDEDDIFDVFTNLILYVEGVTTSNEYSPGCALEVWLDLEEEFDDDDDDSDAQIEEAVQVSFDQTNNIRFRPASKFVVKNLIRKVYNKKIKKAKRKTMSLEECTICLEEFNDGGSVVTLPCGHDFDDECIVKWFETSHVCPLCRYELPCEDQ